MFHEGASLVWRPYHDGNHVLFWYSASNESEENERQRRFLARSTGTTITKQTYQKTKVQLSALTRTSYYNIYMCYM